VRRSIAGLIAFLAVTAGMLALPVYTAPHPQPGPVKTSSQAVSLGSLDAPAASADVQEGTTQPVAGVAETAPVLTLKRTGTAPFSLVGVTWAHDPAVTDIVVMVRAQHDGGSWGSWTEVTVEDADQEPGTDSGTALRGGTAPLWTGRSTGVGVELVTRSGASPTDVQLDLVNPGTTPADSALGAPVITDTAQAASPMPPVYSRAQWGADESIRTWDPEFAPTIKAATIHHTADSNDYGIDDVPAILRSIYRYHAVSRGWGDIGYNVIADKFGRLWEGRYGGLASTVIGAHAGGFNTGTFGVSMIGNYDLVQPTRVMVEAVASIIAWKFSLYGVNPNGTTTLTSAGGGTSRYAAGTPVTLPTIFGHRDVGSTACPGQYGYAQLPTIRSLVAAEMPQYSNPSGSLDLAAGGEEQMTLAGWAYDPDQPTSATQLHVYLDGTWNAAITTGTPRADIANYFPRVGPAPGFYVTLPAPAGNHTACVYAINVGLGQENTPLGCRKFTVQRVVHEPRGAVDFISALGNQVTFGGWALDIDAPTTSLSIHAYVDGAFAGAFPAAWTRPDIAAAYPAAGAAHGFGSTLTIPVGTHTVCLYAINLGAGAVNPALGCKTVTYAGISAMNPLGALDGATVKDGMLAVGGWVVDPDAPTSPADVHLYADGRFLKAWPAGGDRPDVGAVLPGAGAAHGFWTSVPLEEGKHTVCAYGINVGQGNVNTPLGCAPVTVPAGTWSPKGALDAVAVSDRTAIVAGWAFDPDVPTTSIPVHVYVDGAFAGAQVASGARPDVAAVVPGVGPAHGYYLELPLTAGKHSVCVYAINQGLGSVNSGMGCRTITAEASAWNPLGAVDAVSRSGTQLTFNGWAYDPSAPTTAVKVDVRVDNTLVTQVTAGDNTRPDVETLHPGAGAAHGYSSTLTVTDAPHTVCFSAVNVGSGTADTQLGCRTVS
jgi:uncharacterized protein with LGFP repeats